jgi:hypothetical protein
MSVWLQRDVEVLLAEASPTLQPPTPWKPFAAPAFDWKPSVLLVGGELPRRDRAIIERTGVLERVETIQGGLTRLGGAAWDVVVVAPSIADETDGVRFVRAFKGATALVGASAALQALRSHYRRTPFVVLPVARDDQFAVFYSASRWFLGNTWAVPLAEAIVRCVER